MSGLRAALIRLGNFVTRKAPEGLNEELQLHTEMVAQEYMRNGMTEGEALRAAKMEVGNATRIHETYREQNGVPLLEAFAGDLKYSLRTLTRTPSFAISCIAALALGLAGVITMGGILSSLLFEPLHYPHPKRLIALQGVDPRGSLWPLSEPALLDLMTQAKTLAAVGAYQRSAYALTANGEPENLQGAAISGSFLQVFSIQPVFGKLFASSKGRTTPRREVVISRDLWKRSWHSEPSVVGRSIRLNGQDYVIAGVATFPQEIMQGIEVLIPSEMEVNGSRTAHELETVGRVRGDVSLPEAQAELRAIAARVGSHYRDTNQGWSTSLIPLADYINGPTTVRTLWVLFAAVTLIWFLACANIGGLLVARGIARNQEMSTRFVLGASRTRLVGQMFTESAVLAFAGTFIALCLACGALAVIRAFGASYIARLGAVHMDAGTAGIAVAAALFSTLLFGVFPALSLRGERSVSDLRGGRNIAKSQRSRDFLVVVQVAFAAVLLVTAALFFTSFRKLSHVDPGFDSEHLLAVRIGLPDQEYGTSKRIEFFREVTESLKNTPGIKAVGATNVVPFTGWGTANRFRLQRDSRSNAFHSAAWRSVTPGFFTAMGIPLKRGRFFSESDVSGSEEVVVITESMARRFWPHEDPIGKRLLWGRSQNPKTIVGVAGDIRDVALEQPSAPMMFRPYAQLSDPPMALVIRTSVEAGTLWNTIRQTIRKADPNLPLEMEPVSAALTKSIDRPRANMLSMAAFSCTALLIASVGLYGLLTYRVNQQQSEIGIRLALGATPGRIHWGIQKHSLSLVLLGLLAGVPLCFLSLRLVSALLYDTQPEDPAAYLAVTAVLAAVSLVASYGPARRAAHMDPSASLRSE